MLSYPDILVSNNINAFGIIKANEIQGHRFVQNIGDLYLLTDPQLSLSGNNTNNDSLGSRWYVTSERTVFELVDWNKRKTADGWRKSDSYSKTEIDKKISDLTTNMVWKPAVASFSEIATIYPSPKEGWTVSTTDDNKIYRFDAATNKWINIFDSQQNIASATQNGLLTKELWTKLNGLSNYIHPANHPATMIQEDENHLFMTKAEREKLNGLSNYIHPANHPATMIQEDENHLFMTKAEREKLNGLNNYDRPASISPTLINQDASHRFVTDVEKNKWNGLVGFPGYFNTGSYFGTSTKAARHDHKHQVLDGVEVLSLTQTNGVSSIGIGDHVFDIHANTTTNVFGLTLNSMANYMLKSKLELSVEPNNFKITANGVDMLIAGYDAENFNMKFQNLLFNGNNGKLTLSNTNSNKNYLEISESIQKLFGKQVSFDGHKHTLADISNLQTLRLNWNNIDNKPNLVAEHQNIFNLTINSNGTAVGTFKPKEANATVNIEVPTKTSQLTNDSNFINKHQTFADLISNTLDTSNSRITDGTQFLSSIGDERGFNNQEYKNKVVSTPAEFIYEYVLEKLNYPWNSKVTIINNPVNIEKTEIDSDNYRNVFILNLTQNIASESKNTFSFKFNDDLLNSDKYINVKCLIYTNENNNIKITFDKHNRIFGDVQNRSSKNQYLSKNSFYTLDFYSFNDGQDLSNRVGFVKIIPMYLYGENVNLTEEDKYNTLLKLNNKKLEISYIDHTEETGTEKVLTLNSHEYHKFGELTKLTILESTENTKTYLREFMFCFETGSNNFELILPQNIKKPTQLQFIPNHVYQMSIIDNVLQYGAIAVR